MKREDVGCWLGRSVQLAGRQTGKRTGGRAGGRPGSALVGPLVGCQMATKLRGSADVCLIVQKPEVTLFRVGASRVLESINQMTSRSATGAATAATSVAAVTTATTTATITTSTGRPFLQAIVFMTERTNFTGFLIGELLKSRRRSLANFRLRRSFALLDV